MYEMLQLMAIQGKLWRWRELSTVNTIVQ